MRSRFLTLFLALAMLVACAPREEALISQNGLEIYAPSATTAKAGEVSGVFMVIKNTGPSADWLTGVTTAAAEMAQMHETKMENDVMTMTAVDALVIPAGETLELKHGGYHIMLMNLKKDLVAGQTLTLTLKFKAAGEVVVPVPVKAP